MKKLVIGLICIMFGLALTGYAQATYAGESGLWYDPTRDGEGININIHEGRLVAFFYTYGEYDCDPIDKGEPTVGPVPQGHDCSINGQRWFFISGDKIVDGEASGFLYITRGVDFPVGEQDPANPFNQVVGSAFPIGIYILQQSSLGGWDFLVLPFGSIIDQDDDLFVRVWTFTDQLFPATD